MSFESIWSEVMVFYYDYSFAFKIFASLLGAGIVHFILHLVYKKVHDNLKETHRLWDDALTKAVYIPIRLGIWVTALYLCLQVFHVRFHLVFFEGVRIFFYLVVLFIVFLFFILFARGIVDKVVKSSTRKVHSMTINALSKVYYIIVSMVTALAALNILGIPLSAVIAFGGVGGIAVGFAAKDFLANLFGGLMIFVGRPFVIGDTISSPDRNIMGTVEEMGWRQVKLRTFERRPLYVPNSLFSTIVVENVARMHSRRSLFDIALRYQDIHLVAPICKALEKYILGRKDIDLSMSNYVRFIEYADSSVNIRVCCYPATTVYVDYLDIQQEIFLKTAEIVKKKGADFAYPTRTLYSENKE